MNVSNETRGTCLISHGRTALSFWARSKGLLGTSSLDPGDGLLIEPCNSIHSIGMRYPFDAVFINREGKVLHIISRMKPSRLSRHVFGARGVLELPAGTVEATGTQKGDLLRIMVGVA
jgi:uncharacterized membrane protein (UPF0127 family)